MRFQLDERTVMIAHVCDVMTDVNHRRRGLLSRLGKLAHSDWQKHHVAFLTGLHYGGWGSRRVFLGWRPVRKAKWMYRPIKGPYHCILKPISILTSDFESRYRVDTPNTFGPEFDELWMKLRVCFTAITIRDRAWLQYRYSIKSGYHYHILLARSNGQPSGFLIYRVNHKEAQIADWLCAPHDSITWHLLVSTLIERLSAQDVRGIRVLVPERSSFSKRFRRHFFFTAKGSFDVSVVPLSANCPDWNDWFFTAGDFDVV
jgi:hypothetical protein